MPVIKPATAEELQDGFQILYEDLKADVVTLLDRFGIFANAEDTVASLIGSVRQAFALPNDLVISDNPMANREVLDDTIGAKLALLRTGLRNVLHSLSPQETAQTDMELIDALHIQANARLGTVFEHAATPALAFIESIANQKGSSEPL